MAWKFNDNQPIYRQIAERLTRDILAGIIPTMATTVRTFFCVLKYRKLVDKISRGIQNRITVWAIFRFFSESK